MSTPIDAGKLAEDIKTLVKDAESLLRASAEGAEELTQEARLRTEQSLVALRRRLGDLQRNLQGRVTAVDDYVHDKPWTAVGIAGGAALILGLLIGRR